MTSRPATSSRDNLRPKARPLPRLAPAGQTLPNTPDLNQDEAGRTSNTSQLRARTKVWIERDDGSVLISEFRAELLEAVATLGSVAAAARALGLPYRTAWKKLEEMEAAAKAPLLASASGGPGGGRTSLTNTAREMLEAYRRLRAPVSADVDARFEHEHDHFT